MIRLARGLARGLALLQSRDLARVLAPYLARGNVSNFGVPFCSAETEKNEHYTEGGRCCYDI